MNATEQLEPARSSSRDLRERQPMIVGHTFYQVKLSRRSTADRTVPTVTNQAVYVTIVEALKAAI